MSDVLTVKKAVAMQWRLPGADSDGDLEDDILGMAICEALKDLRAQEYWFNTREETLTLVVDQARYERLTKGDPADSTKLPWYFWGLVGRLCAYDKDADSTPPYYPVYVENNRAFDKAQWGSNTSGLPQICRVWKRKLDIWRPPQEAGILHYRCLKDLETPYPNWTGSAWEYIGADGAAISSFDTFTTTWFTEAFDLLCSRVAVQYFRRYRRDPKKETAALTSYAQARKELRKESDAFVTQGTPSAWLGSPGGGYF